VLHSAWGHDKGSVESRGKGVRLQHLTPIPQGETLEAIATAVLAEVEQSWQGRVRRDGQEPAALWEQERQGLLPLPERPFEVRRLVTTSASRMAPVQVEGVVYSVPSTWAHLDVDAYVGVTDIRLVCRGEEQVVARERPGGKQVQYRHYLPELAKKPQAVRQVAPELLEELGEPFRQLWSLPVRPQRGGPAAGPGPGGDSGPRGRSGGGRSGGCPAGSRARPAGVHSTDLPATPGGAGASGAAGLPGGSGPGCGL
jgi:hypothetical protein